MVTWQDIVAEARTYLGTPFHHQGRLKGVGVDCVGLVTGVAKTLGLAHHDSKAYARQADGETMMREMALCSKRVIGSSFKYGDVLVFWFAKKGVANHMGIATDVGLIHTYHSMSRGGRVVEVTLDDFWQKRLMAIYRFNDVERAPSIKIDKNVILRTKKRASGSG